MCSVFALICLYLNIFYLDLINFIA
jgi:hypothetical protein